MASDTKKKKTANTASVKAKKTVATKEAATKSAPKKSTTVKKSTTKKTTSTKTVKSDVKASTTKKVTTKKATTKAAPKKSTTAKTGTKKKSTAKKVVDLAKTLIIPREEIDEKLEIDELKVEKDFNKEETKKSNNNVENSVRTVLGLDLPTGKTKEEKRERLGLYAKDSLVFAIIIPIIDLFAMLFIKSYQAFAITNNTTVNYCLTLVFDFILIFVLTYIIDYAHGESNVKRINK